MSEVTQADRDAAGELWQALHFPVPSPHDGQAQEMLEAMAYAFHDRTIEATRALSAEVEALRDSAQFLIDRLSELEWHDDGYQDVMRDYFGHVEPAVGRMKALLNKEPAR